MPEEQQTTAEQKASAEAFEMPDELSEADIAELLHLTSGKAPDASAAETEGDDDDGADDTRTDDGDAADEAADDGDDAAKNVTLTQEQLAQMAQGVAQATMSAQQQQGAQKKAPEEEDVVAELIRQNPGLDEDGARFMVNAVTPLLKRQLGTLEQRIAGLQQYIVANTQKQAVEGLRSALNREMDRLKVDDDPDEREDLFDLTVSRGLRTHGQAFDEARAIQELRKIHNRRVKRAYDQRKTTVATKKEAAEQTPPVSHVQGTKTVGSDVFKALRDPKNKDMDIGSPGFNKLLKWLVKTPGKALEELLG